MLYSKHSRNPFRRCINHVIGAALIFALSTHVTMAAPPSCQPWSGWQTFKTRFMNDGGRIVDIGTPRKHTVSEAQAYALFFSLVANDRQAFEKILQWTENNLAAGDLTAHLPAWHWGLKDDGDWGVLDDNPASDADLWIAYALGEAGRLWNDRRYVALANLLANRIWREETVDIPGLGRTLLPAPKGFNPENGSWRLNPSYAPIQLLRRLKVLYPQVPWTGVVDSSFRMLIDSAPKGFSPDWVSYKVPTGFLPDTKTRAEGSYDSIRVYLWAGMLSPADPLRQTLLNTLRPMAETIISKGVPPEKINVTTGEFTQGGPVGFSAAVIPFLDAIGEAAASQEQRQRLEARPLAERPLAYYENALTLFAMGWKDALYRFEADGSLVPRWKEKTCPIPASPSLR
jgi:endoglucanase